MIADITSVRQKIQNTSAEEVTASFFDKIESSKINGWITLAQDSAIAQARKIDAEDHSGPLAGIPIAIKDNISTKGMAATCGSKILSGYIPPYDAHVIEKLKAAGAIILGKVNMDEFAMGTSTETSYYGVTKNPWDLSRVSGGSSGGSAAVVAAGEAPISLGSDTGGSVRCPASFCGVVGLKPTYGAVSRYGLIAYASSLDQIGPMGHTVADCAQVMDVIGDHDPRDSTCVGKQTDASYTSALVDDVAGMKIGVPSEYFGEGIDADVEKSVWGAIHKLESLGATYNEVTMPHTDYALAAYYIIATSEASSNLARFDGMRYGLRLDDDTNIVDTYSRIRSDGFGEEVKRRILLGTYALSAGYHDKYYLKALKVRTLIKQDFEGALKDNDVLIAPTMPQPAFKIGEKIDDPLTLYMADVNTVPINLAGVPSISVPCGFTNGLPIGLQIIGKHFDETTIIRAAHTFEQNTDYHTKSPEVV